MLTPDHIPSTGRKTMFQASQLGYASVEAFAKSLPGAAVVIDVGAGWSRLGHEVTALRPDIRWINVDPCYAGKTAIQNALSNLEFLSEDIVKGSAKLAELNGTADLVYSYWMLPHLSLESDKPARAAIDPMYDLLKPEGKLVIGPIKRLGLGLFSLYRYKGTVTYTKAQPKEDVATDVVRKTKLWWLPRAIQLFSNRHNIHLGAKLVGGK
jgi:hypothetical protein